MNWAKAQGFHVGKMGDQFAGINILERNRATVYERWRKGIEELRQYMQKNYLDKGIHAIIYGIDTPSGAQYAVFVQDFFLTEVAADDE